MEHREAVPRRQQGLQGGGSEQAQRPLGEARRHVSEPSAAASRCRSRSASAIIISVSPTMPYFLGPGAVQEDVAYEGNADLNLGTARK